MIDSTDLINFCWSAIAGGAFYDGLKGVLGAGFEQLLEYKKNDKKEFFDISLTAILSTNEEIKKAITDMAQGNRSTETTIISTGNIQAGGAVIVGSHNTIGGSK